MSQATEKQIAIEAMQQMSENATLREISEELAMLAAIREGEADADAGRIISHEEVKRRSATWIGK